MTPTEQDKELREAITKIVEAEYKSPNYMPAVERIDYIMQLITADRKRVALEARIEEVGRIIERVWGLDYGEETEKYLSVRIAELKAQQEEVK